MGVEEPERSISGGANSLFTRFFGTPKYFDCLKSQNDLEEGGETRGEKMRSCPGEKIGKRSFV